MAIEIVDLPITSMVIFHGCVNFYERSRVMMKKMKMKMKMKMKIMITMLGSHGTWVMMEMTRLALRR